MHDFADRWLARAGLLGFLVIGLGPPLALVGGLPEGGGAPRWAALTDMPALRLLGRTAGLAVGAALVAGVVGTLYAACQLAAGRRARAALRLLAPLPVLLPPYLAATAWVRLLGGADAPVDIYGWPGAACSLGLSLFPLVAIPVAVALAALGGGPVDAARLALGPARRLRLRLGAVRGHLLGGMALVFCLAASNLAVPLVLRSNVYALEVFTQFSAYYNVAQAVVVTLPLVGMGLLALVLRQQMIGRAPQVLTAPGWRPVGGGRSWAAATGGLTIMALAAGLPLAVLTRDVGSLAAFNRSLTIAGEEVLVSLRVAAGASLLMVAVGAGCGRWLADAGPRARAWIGSLVLVPLVLPGAIVGLGLLSADRWLPRLLSDSEALLMLAAASRFVPFAALLGWAAAARVDPRFDEAARLAGLDGGRRWLRVRLPLAAPDLLAAFAFGFAFAMSELAASVLVSPPGTTTLAVRLASLLHFGEDAMVSALCLISAASVLLVIGIVTLATNRILELRLGPAA